MGTLHEYLPSFMIISRSFLRRKRRNISDKSCRENQHTYLRFDKCFRKWCRQWDNVK